MSELPKKVKDSFIVRKKYQAQLKAFSQQQKADWVDAVFHYQETGEILEGIDPIVGFLISVMSNEWVEDNRKYETKCNINSDNGAKWWAKKGNQNARKNWDNVSKQPKQAKQPKQPKQADMIWSDVIWSDSKYKNIFNARNKKKITAHRSLTQNIKDDVDKILKDLSEEEVKTAIENYATIYHSEKTYFKHKWTLSEFLSRKNGARVFLYKSEADYIDKDLNKKSEPPPEQYSSKARNLEN